MREFDYVIVGAGSAGCVLAERLSADRGLRVLLLEAGGWDWHPLLRIPLGVGRIWGFGRFDWGYETEPEPHAADRRIETARGKIIGGCHSINAMGHVRGHRSDYDRWSRLGLGGWSYAEVLPYFKRAETWEGGESPYRGGTGPIYERRTKNMDPLYEAYIQAGVKAGHPFTGLQRRAAARVRLGTMDHPQRPARQHRTGLSASCIGAAKSPGRSERACAPDCD